jgi:hypothetical protein
MGLSLEKLRNVKHRGTVIYAQCPACAEKGNDKKGNHLFINLQGQFGCVVFPGKMGAQHRKLIFELAGEKNKEMENRSAKQNLWVKRPDISLSGESQVMQKDVLGHLGHLF